MSVKIVNEFMPYESELKALDAYDEMLRDATDAEHGSQYVELFGYHYDRVNLWKNGDLTAYHQGFLDFLDSLNP